MRVVRWQRAAAARVTGARVRVRMRVRFVSNPRVVPRLQPAQIAGSVPDQTAAAEVRWGAQPQPFWERLVRG